MPTLNQLVRKVENKWRKIGRSLLWNDLRKSVAYVPAFPPLRPKSLTALRKIARVRLTNR